MNFNKTMMLVSALAAGLCVAAVPGDTAAYGRYGATQCDVTATLLYANQTGSRNAVSIQNLGPNAIYIGFDSSVTTATGTQVPASGGSLSVDLRMRPDGTPKIYCIAATALQVSPNDTRWMEIR